jgi:Fe/S biogenesis protein NfuA
MIEEQDKQVHGLRVVIQGRTSNGFRYGMTWVEPGQEAADDTTIDCGAFKVLVDAESAPNMKGTTIDFVDDPESGRSGFKIDNPNPVWTDPKAVKVQELIDTQVNPAVAQHGGVVELLDVKDDVVYVLFGGGCQGCGMIDVTLKQGVEAMLKEAVPEIKSIVDTTDHAAGTNPYYQPAKG